MRSLPAALAFSMYENKGVYALLLGSGISRAAQIPTGWEITLDLIRRAAMLDGVSEQPDWAVWHRDQTGAEPSYSDMLDKLTSVPDERRAILHSYIEPTADDLQEGRKIPTAAHHAIAWLVKEGFVRVIITTNFDRLMENALREAGIEATIVSSDDDLRGAIPMAQSRCFIVKLHGDYLDTRIKNTDAELSAYSPAIDGLLDRVFDEHGLIVCGWSGEWDVALRAAITRAPNRRYPTYWAARGAVATGAEDLIRKRDARVIPIDGADAFFKDLQGKIAAQQDTQRANPRSTALMVATVKRYLGRPEFKIQLNDLVSDEYRQLSAKLLGSGFGLQGQWSDEEFRRRVAHYESAVEPMARLLGVVGRWGDGLEFQTISEIFSSLARKKSEGGLTAWIDLRDYPAVLLFYAYGLGLLKARRYDLLYRWFSLPVRRDSRDTSPAVRCLFLNAWGGGEDGRWHRLKGPDRRKTPLSDHLHDIAGGWTSDYTLADQENTLLFESFETLGALAFLTHSTKEELKKAGAENQQYPFVWSPVGRVSWDSETRGVILSDLEDPATRKTLLQAGFANGDDEHLALSIANIRTLMARMGWY